LAVNPERFFYFSLSAIVQRREGKASVESFHRLLTSPQYEALRGRLMRIFARRGCESPEDLADETIFRVTEKIHEIAATYEGDPARYFYAVARNVYLEYMRRPETIVFEENKTPTQVVDRDPISDEVAYECLDCCLKKLTDNERDLVSKYYWYDKSAKIDHRKKLAENLGIGLNALRIRAYKIRRRLYQCVDSCLKDREDQGK
jgi:RNA polymerase sigma factor (sigma-70 family)